MLRQEGDADVVLGAKAEKEGRHEDVAEADDASDGMDGQLEDLDLLALHDDRLALLPKAGPLRAHVERVQEFPHVEHSLRIAATSA